MRVDYTGERFIGTLDLEKFLRKTMELPPQKVNLIKNQFLVSELQLSQFLPEKNLEDSKVTTSLTICALKETSLIQVSLFWGVKKSVLLDTFELLEKQKISRSQLCETLESSLNNGGIIAHSSSLCWSFLFSLFSFPNRRFLKVSAV